MYWNFISKLAAQPSQICNLEVVNTGMAEPGTATWYVKRVYFIMKK
jgi:hypothetical protein